MSRRARLRWTKNGSTIEVVVTGTRIGGFGREAEIRLLGGSIEPLHVELEMRDNGLWVHDLGSRAGTYLGKERIAHARIDPAGGVLLVGSLMIAVEYVPDDELVPALAGESPPTRAVRAQLDELARDTGPLVIEGEPGTGAVAVARALHERTRPGDPFVALDCRSIPAELIESAVFGHTRSSCFGQPTWDSTNHPGPFEHAGAGTVVLVGLDVVPAELGPKLARVLETRSFRRIGESQHRSANARVIATTRDAASMLQRSPRLRPSLGAAPVLRLPALRDRGDDVAVLLRRLAVELTPALVARVAALRFAGNATQLRRLAELAATATPYAAVLEHELLEQIAAAPGDDELRRVYGDLLQQRGDPRGELVEVQCRLAGASGDELERLRAIERELLALYGTAWTDPVVERTRVQSAQLRRGFVERASLSGDVLDRLGFVLEHAPLLEELELDPIDPHGPLAAAQLSLPSLRRIRRLHASSYHGCDEAALALAGCPYLDELRELALARTRVAVRGITPRAHALTEVGARALAYGFPGLECLDLSACPMTPAAVEVLASTPALRRLRRLVLDTHAASRFTGARGDRAPDATL